MTISSFLHADDSPKVVIVGAGLAGLTTAYRLGQQGIATHVYEARNRVGGRVFTVKVGKNIAELGAQSISDGGAATNLLCLIDEFGIELQSEHLDLEHSYFTGKKMIPMRKLLTDRDFLGKNLKEHLEALAEKANDMSEVLDGLLDKNDPLYKALSTRLCAYEGDHITNLSPMYVETLFHMLMGGLCSAYHDPTKKSNQIEVLSIKQGNAQLPEKMAQALGDHLHLGKQLIKVSKNKDNSFLLTFNDNHKVEADILILAIPCPVYKDIIFEDCIPPQTLKKIREIKYGSNSKILLPTSQDGAAIISDRLVCFTRSNFLTMYYIGASGLFTPSSILDTYNRDKAMIEMEYKDTPSLPPVYAKDLSFESYNGPVGYSWPNDPFALGSYSYIAAGQENLFTDTQTINGELVNSLFAPIDEKLFFAGEHTTILTDVLGTMEAACESGERTARMILSSQK